MSTELPGVAGGFALASTRRAWQLPCPVPKGCDLHS